MGRCSVSLIRMAATRIPGARAPFWLLERRLYRSRPADVAAAVAKTLLARAWAAACVFGSMVLLAWIAAFARAPAKLLAVGFVAIMVAGRSGSAYTAELGSMKMREEIDALSTMGLDPVEVLILPRIIALVCALPILAFVGAMSALYGGGLVAWFYGGMSPPIFIARLHEAVSVTHFEVGIIKSPFMALVIGIIACSEGLRVKGSAESLGTQTTISVVKSIFLVIVLDGAFAVFFASIGM